MRGSVTLPPTENPDSSSLASIVTTEGGGWIRIHLDTGS